MAATVSVPENVAAIFAEDGGALPHWALTAVLVEAVREGRASRGFFRETLGLSVGEADELLASHGILYDFTVEELERDVVNAKRRA